MEELRWIANLRAQWTPSEDEWQEALNCVTDPAERSRVLRYHKGASSPVGYPHHLHSDPKCFVVGRLMLQHAFALSEGVLRCGDSGQFDLPFVLNAGRQHQYDGLCIRRTTEGRPFLERRPSKKQQPFNANISHAGGVVALCAHPHKLVGVDVMPVELSPPGALSGAALRDFFAYFDQTFTELEWKWIDRGEMGDTMDLTRCQKRFFVLWTLKESFVKALGTGIDFPCLRVEFQISSTVEVDHPLFFHDSIGTTERRSETCVTLWKDSQPMPQWSFSLFERKGWNVVGAVSLGPLAEAGTESFRATLGFPPGTEDPKGQDAFVPFAVAHI